MRVFPPHSWRRCWGCTTASPFPYSSESRDLLAFVAFEACDIWSEGYRGMTKTVCNAYPLRRPLAIIRHLKVYMNDHILLSNTGKLMDDFWRAPVVALFWGASWSAALALVRMKAWAPFAFSVAQTGLMVRGRNEPIFGRKVGSLIRSDLIRFKCLSSASVVLMPFSASSAPATDIPVSRA